MPQRRSAAVLGQHVPLVEVRQHDRRDSAVETMHILNESLVVLRALQVDGRQKRRAEPGASQPLNKSRDDGRAACPAQPDGVGQIGAWRYGPPEKRATDMTVPFLIDEDQKYPAIIGEMA